MFPWSSFNRTDFVFFLTVSFTGVSVSQYQLTVTFRRTISYLISTVIYLGLLQSQVL